MATAANTLLFGLIGDPVAHSLSPFIMNRAFEGLGLDAMYVAFGIKPDRLAPSVMGLNALGAAGLNVTYPYKEDILYHIDAISSEAEVINAVNTVMFFDNEVNGFNSDAPGTVTALETFTDVLIEGTHAFVYGLGGSGRAAAYGLLERGAERVTFGTRSMENVPLVLDRFQYAFPEQDIDFVKIGGIEDLDRRREAFRDADIVINATPVGMAGLEKAGDLIEDASWIRNDQTFFDFVYYPKQTAFLQTAQRAGAKTLGGIALLVSQAMESLRIWLDEGFDVKEMAEAVEEFSRAEPPTGRRVN